MIAEAEGIQVHRIPLVTGLINDAVREYVETKGREFGHQVDLKVQFEFKSGYGSGWGGSDTFGASPAVPRIETDIIAPTKDGLWKWAGGRPTQE